jgi:Fic family protein
METKNLQLTKQEADALANIIHVAVKSAGLEGNTTKNGIYFIDKLNALFAEKEKTHTDKVKEVAAKDNLKKKN